MAFSFPLTQVGSPLNHKREYFFFEFVY